MFVGGTFTPFQIKAFSLKLSARSKSIAILFNSTLLFDIAILGRLLKLFWRGNHFC